MKEEQATAPKPAAKHKEDSKPDACDDDVLVVDTSEDNTDVGLTGRDRKGRSKGVTSMEKKSRGAI